jgi:hypothetical protein
MVYVGFVCSVLFAPVWVYLILRAYYEGLGRCVLDVAPEKVAGGIKHRRPLMYLEVHNLNDHETLDMAQGNREAKAETCHRQSIKVSLKNCSRIWVSCQMHKHDKEIEHDIAAYDDSSALAGARDYVSVASESDGSPVRQARHLIRKFQSSICRRRVCAHNA